VWTAGTETIGSMSHAPALPCKGISLTSLFSTLQGITKAHVRMRCMKNNISVMLSRVN
jgi:hypothetical protein